MSHSYRRSFKVLPEAMRAAENPNSSIEHIEFHMRELFALDKITIDVIRVYNRLERQWKCLTRYTDTESKLI